MQQDMSTLVTNPDSMSFHKQVQTMLHVLCEETELAELELKVC